MIWVNNGAGDDARVRDLDRFPLSLFFRLLSSSAGRCKLRPRGGEPPLKVSTADSAYNHRKGRRYPSAAKTIISFSTCCTWGRNSEACCNESARYFFLDLAAFSRLGGP